MKHDPPPPPELGVHDGLAYAMFTPDDEAIGGVVLLHGAGSRKESHFDFGRLCRSYGLAAVAYDARGYGGSSGTFGPTAFDDALAMADLVREQDRAVALRGSSMGGFCAIHAAALEQAEVAAVVAICPAPEDVLLRGLRSGAFEELGWQRETVEPWLSGLDLFGAVSALGPETALLLMHARGDEQVPYTVSEELHRRANEPKRLLLLPGGHHRSLQHDLELQSLSAHFIVEAIAPDS